jgi:predicted component of type VI protein secretion system
VPIRKGSIRPLRACCSGLRVEHVPHLLINTELSDGPVVSAVFGQQGGTIGRGENCTLMLSDAERSVSRLHARVEWREDDFVLVNMGINPVLRNGDVLSTAEEAPLVAGDTLRIGAFTLRVHAVDDQVQRTMPPAEIEEEALFDDMTGLPLRAAWASDFMALHEPSESKVGTEQQWLSSLLRGMGGELPPSSMPLSAEQAGALMRTAMNDTLRTWIAHCSPAVQQAWFSAFEEAFAKACLTACAEAPVGSRIES